MVNSKTYLKAFILCLWGAVIGALGGLAGGGFSLLLSFVTKVRAANPWIILLLPVGGIVTVFLYGIFRLGGFSGTNDMIKYVEKRYHLRKIVAPLIFVTTAISHLLGASAGREGAAIQLGGAGASIIADVFRLKNEKRTAVILCGMSAVFAGVFGIPFTAAVFVLEFRSEKKVFMLSALPCFISALIAEKVSALLGAEKEVVHVHVPESASLLSFAKIGLLAVAVSILAIVMCFVFHKSEHFVKKIITNPYVRIFAGAVVIIGLTWAIGDMRYNGAGMDMAVRAIEGEADWYDFLLKMLFTAVTLSAGFKGGEIVPTFCIGATFGCVFGGLIGIEPGFAAALALAGIFCCATASPLSAVVLAVEMFGIAILPYSIPVCIIAWLLSCKEGLFYGRFFASPVFSRIKTKVKAK